MIGHVNSRTTLLSRTHESVCVEKIKGKQFSSLTGSHFGGDKVLKEQQIVYKLHLAVTSQLHSGIGVCVTILPVHRGLSIFLIFPFWLINLDQCFGDKIKKKKKMELLTHGDISSLLHTFNPIEADNLFMNLSLLCVVFDTCCFDYKQKCKTGAGSRLYAACRMAAWHKCISPVLLWGQEAFE